MSAVKQKFGLEQASDIHYNPKTRKRQKPVLGFYLFKQIAVLQAQVEMLQKQLEQQKQNDKSHDNKAQ